VMAPLLARTAKAPAATQALSLMSSTVASPLPISTHILSVPRADFAPVPVCLGPPAGYAGLVAQARPPHSPIGTASPPETVSAYAPAEAPPPGVALPLAPAPDALPMKGQGAHAKIAAKPHATKRIDAHNRGHARGKMAATHTERHASHKAVKTAHNKASVKQKADTHKKLAAKQHAPAKAAVHGEITKGKKPQKQAKR
jgi:D-alanyl-D-alanine carboxypeptidase